MSQVTFTKEADMVAWIKGRFEHGDSAFKCNLQDFSILIEKLEDSEWKPGVTDRIAKAANASWTSEDHDRLIVFRPLVTPPFNATSSKIAP